MARPRRTLNVLTDWDQSGAAAEANAADLPHLEAPRIKLQRLSTAARSLLVEQSTLAASKQEVTKRLQQVLRQGQALADFIRTGVREHFGPTSEKLTEFGMVPFRGRSRKNTPAPTGTPSQESPETPPATPTPETVK